MSDNQSVIPQCTSCGSTSICKDALASWATLASWDIDKQEWVLASEYDSGHCESCGVSLKRFNWVPTQSSTKE